MKNKTICLPDELCDKLKEETNASGLITRLLIEHYKFNDKLNKEEILKKKEKLLQDINNSNNLIVSENKRLENEANNFMSVVEQEKLKKIEELKKIEDIEHKLTEEEKEELVRINKEKQKEQDFKYTFYNNFSFIVGKEPTREEFEEFKKLWSKKESYSMYDFIYSKYPELNADIEEVLEDIKEDGEEKTKED